MFRFCMLAAFAGLALACPAGAKDLSPQAGALPTYTGLPYLLTRPIADDEDVDKHQCAAAFATLNSYVHDADMLLVASGASRAVRTAVVNTAAGPKPSAVAEIVRDELPATTDISNLADLPDDIDTRIATFCSA